MSKITAYASLASAQSDDLLPIVDVHDQGMASSGTTKKVTVRTLAVAATGVTVLVPAPAGATAADTPAVTTAIASLVSALSFGPATLQFQDGTYQVDSNSAVIRSVSNFAVRGTGATVIAQAPNRAGLVNNVTGDLFVIADCTDFRVEGLTLDGLRDTVSPMTPLTASASSAQPSVTVASGQGSRYLAGQNLILFGGLGTAESNQSDGFSPGAGTPLVISSVTPGGGSGGGDLITFTTNLGNSYAQISSTAFSDGFGPYAYAGAYLTPYQCANGNSVAGRTLSGEDQQCGLHLLNCQRFTVTRVTARNLWESPVKMGTGFEPANGSLTDGCQQGTITDCTGYHAYDQGISVWLSKNITVKGCLLNAAGWAGISLTASDNCTVTGNQILNSYYRVPTDSASGSGICIEGGLHNQVKGNIITGVYADGFRLTPSPLGWGAYAASAKTTSAYLTAGTAAGTSIQISSTTGLSAGAPYSLIDGPRTEAVTVATVVDSTHVTFGQALAYSHPSGTYLGQRIAQENVIEGNTVFGPQSGSGIKNQQCVRTRIRGNVFRNWAASGIVLSAATWGPAGSYLGGDGSAIEANTCGEGTGECLVADSAGDYLIRGNRLYGASTQALLLLQGVTDSVIEGNFLSDMESGPGLRIQNGGILTSVAAARLTITGNKIKRLSNEGILILNGDSLTITGNSVSSCGGNAGINPRGVTRSVIADNVCVSNKTAGIQLEDNSSNFCQWNRVTGNTCRDDGTGINVTTGAGWTQQHGIVEKGTSNFNLITGNECDSNAVDQLTTVGAGTDVFANIISGALSSAPLTVPDYGGLFGDGSDGAVAMNGTNTFAGFATLVGSTYTLTRDVFATSLTVSSGVTLQPAGFRIFCQGTVTNAGTIAYNGNNASGATKGGNAASGSLQGGQSGGAGLATGTGAAGGTANGTIGTGSSGAGGNGSGNSGGAAIAPKVASAAQYRIPAAILAAATTAAGAIAAPCGAPGGSAGGGDGTASGGGGGGGAGIIAILAWAVVNSGTISAAGGIGGTPPTGNCGGGGPGGGGLILAYTLAAWTAGTTIVAAGTPGSGVGTGTAGSAGTSGTVLNVIVQ